jgi:hypothetical protein
MNKTKTHLGKISREKLPVILAVKKRDKFIVIRCFVLLYQIYQK